jgi:hypothetical protein
LWRCWAAPEHGIARAKPRDPRLGEYSAISPIELSCQALAMWVPSLLRGYHEKASPSVQFASRVDLMPGFADRTVSSRAGRLATDNTIGIFDLCQPARPMPRPKENIVRSVPSANVGGGRCVSRMERCNSISPRRRDGVTSSNRPLSGTSRTSKGPISLL